MSVLRPRRLLRKVELSVAAAFLLAGALTAQTTPMCEGPLSREQVVGLLKGSVSPRRVKTLVEQCGINFDVSDDVAQALIAAGADDALVLTVRQQASPAVRQALEHVRRGDQAFADGFFAKAASEYTQAWQAMPSRGDIGLKAARLWKDRGDPVQSARILNAILALPDSPAAADARQLLNEIQPSLQASFERKLNEGLSLMGGRDVAGAAQAFADAAAISPERSEPHVHMSRLYALQKNLNGATGEILLAVKRGNVSATQLLAYDEFEAWLQDQQFLSFLGDVYGTAEVNAALDARRGKKAEEQRIREADARRRDLQRRLPQLLQEAAAAEQSAQATATKARQAEYEAQQANSSATTVGGVVAASMLRSRARNWRQAEKETTERAARLRQEASALQAELAEAIRQAEATPKTPAQAAPLAAPPAVPNQGGTEVAAGTAAQVQALMEKGDRFVEERYYSQALVQYDKALTLTPEDPDVLDRLAKAQFFLDDFREGEAIWERVLSLGKPITIPIAHNHSFGSCSGILVIEKGTLSYRSGKSEDNFKVDRASLLAAQGGILTGTNFPRLVIRWRDAKGKEKTYYMLLYGFLQPVGGGSILPRMFVGNEEAIRKTSKMRDLVLRLVNQYLK